MSHLFPVHPGSQIHLAPEQEVAVQDALHCPCPLQCSVVVPAEVEHGHRLHARSQSFQPKYLLQVPPCLRS